MSPYSGLCSPPTASMVFQIGVKKEYFDYRHNFLWQLLDGAV